MLARHEHKSHADGAVPTILPQRAIWPGPYLRPCLGRHDTKLTCRHFSVLSSSSVTPHQRLAPSAFFSQSHGRHRARHPTPQGGCQGHHADLEPHHRHRADLVTLLSGLAPFRGVGSSPWYASAGRRAPRWGSSHTHAGEHRR